MLINDTNNSTYQLKFNNKAKKWYAQTVNINKVQ